MNIFYVAFNYVLNLCFFSGIVVYLLPGELFFAQGIGLVYVFSFFGLLFLYLIVLFSGTGGFIRVNSILRRILFLIYVVVWFLYGFGWQGGWLEYLVSIHSFIFCFLVVISFYCFTETREVEFEPCFESGILATYVVLVFLFLAVLLVLDEENSLVFFEYGDVSEYSYPYGESPFLPSLTTTVNNRFVPEEVIGNSNECGLCHYEEFLEWESSVHSQASSDPFYIKNIDLLVRDHGIPAARYCEGCHSPIALLSGQLGSDGFHGGTKGSVSHNQGVSCMSCHGISKINGTQGMANYELDASKTYLFSQVDSKLLKKLYYLLIYFYPDVHKMKMRKDILDQPELCSSCHVQFMDEKINNWTWFKMQDEYSAWLESPFSGKNLASHSTLESKSCVDCHMINIEDRKKRTSHRFLGANTALPFLNQDLNQLRLSKKFLMSNVVGLRIQEPRFFDDQEEIIQLNDDSKIYARNKSIVYAGKTIDISVLVSNNLVGHNFPGGTTDINEVWIEFVAIDGSGKEFFSSGKIINGYVDEDSHFLASKPIDKFGDIVWKHDLFRQVGNVYNRVVKSGKSESFSYNVEIPFWARSPITFSARLNYRKLNKKYASWALNDSSISLPVTEMASHAISVPLRIDKGTAP